MNPEHFALLDEARRTLPDGFKAEISGDTIAMVVSPSGIHQRNLLTVRRQFDAHSPAGLLPSEDTGLVSPDVGKSRNPDLTCLPDDAPAITDNQVPAEVTAIAVELVVPSDPENDWIGKVRDYPLMGIPLYLLIDARPKTVTLFSRPDGTKYHRREDIGFGETLRIPDPFDFDLVTDGLLPHWQSAAGTVYSESSTSRLPLPGRQGAEGAQQRGPLVEPVVAVPARALRDGGGEELRQPPPAAGGLLVEQDPAGVRVRVVGPAVPAPRPRTSSPASSGPGPRPCAAPRRQERRPRQPWPRGCDEPVERGVPLGLPLSHEHLLAHLSPYA